MGKKCILENCNEDAFGFYPHCKKHLEQIKTGEIYKDENGKWKEKNKKEIEVKNLLNAVNSKINSKKEIIVYVDEVDNDVLDKENGVVVIDNENKSKCITCGRKTDGLLFCGSCYHKYKNKELLFKITRCTDVELLDSSYEGRHTCSDGHVVKSKSEILIDNYLFEKNIAHAYESSVSYGPGRNDVLHPDFYLKNYLGEGKDVYIEHWGYNENNVDYTKTKKFKLSKYREQGITLICTHEKTDMKDINFSLGRKLKKENIKFGEINFENEND